MSGYEGYPPPPPPAGAGGAPGPAYPSVGEGQVQIGGPPPPSSQQQYAPPPQQYASPPQQYPPQYGGSGYYEPSAPPPPAPSAPPPPAPAPAPEAAPAPAPAPAAAPPPSKSTQAQKASTRPVQLEGLGKKPTVVKCPHCGKQEKTKVDYGQCTKRNCCMWGISWIFVSFWIGICLFTDCCCNCGSDATHNCQDCGMTIGTG